MSTSLLLKTIHFDRHERPTNEHESTTLGKGEAPKTLAQRA